MSEPPHEQMVEQLAAIPDSDVIRGLRDQVEHFKSMVLTFGETMGEVGRILTGRDLDEPELLIFAARQAVARRDERGAEKQAEAWDLCAETFGVGDAGIHNPYRRQPGGTA